MLLAFAPVAQEVAHVAHVVACVIGSVVAMLLCVVLLLQVLLQFVEQHCLRPSSRSAEASLRHHMTHMCKLTLDLVTSWPPLIVSKPEEFREDWHDREYQYWEKHKSSTGRLMKLLYTRPVLFRSYKGNIGAKGWVGNKEKGREAGGEGGGGRVRGRGIVSSRRLSGKMRNGTTSNSET